MTKGEARKLVWRILATTIDCDFASGAGWMFHDHEGHEYSQADFDRLQEAARAIMFYLKKKGGGFQYYG